MKKKAAKLAAKAGAELAPSAAAATQAAKRTGTKTKVMAVLGLTGLVVFLKELPAIVREVKLARMS